MTQLRALTDAELDAVSGAGYSYKKVVVVKKGGDGGRGGNGGDGGWAISLVNINLGGASGGQLNNTSADGGAGGNGGRGGDA